MSSIQASKYYKPSKERTLTEPFRIKVVEPIRSSDYAYRKQKLEEAYYNPFQLHSEDVYIDMLTDSGTGAMSDRQWAAMMLGDESYAGAKSWIKLKKVVQDLSSMPFVLPTHQGRAAERILYGILGGKGKLFISNTHFDTTRANIEFTGAKAIDIPVKKESENELFLGNIDVSLLKEILKENKAEDIGAVIVTVTNNSAGGQPVSMQNMKDVKALCLQYGVRMVIDACRIAENSYFIRKREAGFENQGYKEIAQEILAMGDAFIMSAKKDGMVNMGGLLVLKDESLYNRCNELLIISEGFTTYGGLSGRDMEALAVGLEEVFDPDYLEYRIRSTAYLGEGLKAKGVPVVWPIGGHAVYIDAGEMFSKVPRSEFPGQVLVCELYLAGGIRSVEVGSVMFGKYDSDGNPIFAQRELVRLAIPRRVYTQSHFDYVLDVFDDVIRNKNISRGYMILNESEFLRHFTVQFAPV